MECAKLVIFIYFSCLPKYRNKIINKKKIFFLFANLILNKIIERISHVGSPNYFKNSFDFFLELSGKSSKIRNRLESMYINLDVALDSIVH